MNFFILFPFFLKYLVNAEYSQTWTTDIKHASKTEAAKIK